MSRVLRMGLLRSVALGLALAYILLSLVAYACPTDVHAAHAHHGGQHKPVHSPACSWACQLSFSDAIHATGHPDAPMLLLIATGAVSFVWRPCTPIGLIRTRAPPFC